MNKALFLDRDGVVNVEKNYVYKIEDFDFMPGIFDLCKNYQKKGYLIIVFTNQAGIARGFYTVEDFQILTNWMVKQFEQNEVKITDVYHCPHHPEFTGECECRKPNPGMLLEAGKEYNIDFSQSIVVGDKESDLEAGRRCGIKKLYHVDDWLKKVYE